MKKVIFLDNGSMAFNLWGQNAKIMPESTWVSEKVENVTTIFGRFKINDRVTIMNRGFLKKENIVW
jgi:hypothetical protein